MGTYFDANEFTESPLKTLIRTYYYNLDKKLATGNNFYIKRQNLTTYDSWMSKFVGRKDYSFIDIEMGEVLGGNANNLFFPFSAYFMISPNAIEIERQVTSMLDVLMNAGGLFNVLFIVGKTFLAFFSNKLFAQDIIPQLYYEEQAQS